MAPPVPVVAAALAPEDDPALLDALPALAVEVPAVLLITTVLLPVDAPLDVDPPILRVLNPVFTPPMVDPPMVLTLRV